MILGKACDLIDHHQELKKTSVSSPSKQPPVTPVPKEEPQKSEEKEEKIVNLTSSGEDMALLEAKLQTVERSAMRILPSMTSVMEDNLDPIKEEDNDLGNSQNHRWSNNRRSQLIKQHQGELNKVVFSDSRRRPLSCTPPASTSISTSVSIDEDEPPKKEEKESELEIEPIVMRPKALSSPDFMKSYKPAYDAERDWPPMDDDEVDAVIENSIDDDIEVSEAANPIPSRRGSHLSERRGSSEDRLRRRKRYDTDRV